MLEPAKRGGEEKDRQGDGSQWVNGKIVDREMRREGEWRRGVVLMSVPGTIHWCGCVLVPSILRSTGRK